MSSPRVSRQSGSSSWPVLPLVGGGVGLGGVGVFGGGLGWLLGGVGWCVVCVVVDFVLLCCGVAAAVATTSGGGGGGGGVGLLFVLPVVVVVCFGVLGLYRTRLRTVLSDSVLPVLSGVSIAVVALAAVNVLLDGPIANQTDWARTWALSLLLVGTGRAVLATTQRHARTRGTIARPVLIMGAGIIGSRVARRLQAHPEYGLQPVGFLDDDPRSVADVGGRSTPVLGTIKDLQTITTQTGVRHLIVAFSTLPDAHVNRLIQHCQTLGIQVSVIPRMFDTINNRARYDTLGGLPLLTYTATNPRSWQFKIKHTIDRLAATLLLLALTPLTLLIALLVKTSSPGPVLFRQRRVGRDGTTFDLYKFRSMHTQPPNHNTNNHNEDGFSEQDTIALSILLGADTAPGGVEGPNDRRTLIGRILRRTSLDELPQLLNVLRGEMSLIGPRPERPEFVHLFNQEDPNYQDRHRVKSGITGWAQVHGLRGQTSLAERIEWDNYYITNWTPALDLKILTLTLKAILHHTE
jgi:exopolysaccharide biosynthesis polyprenyl glycosylphosphotransferase